MNDEENALCEIRIKEERKSFNRQKERLLLDLLKFCDNPDDKEFNVDEKVDRKKWWSLYLNMEAIRELVKLELKFLKEA